MIDKINIKYGANVNRNNVSEETLKTNINMWFCPLADEINKEGSIIELFVDNEDFNNISFSNISTELKFKATERLKLFQNKFPY